MRTNTTDPENSINGRDRTLYNSKNVISLIARILLSAIFVWSGVNKVLDPAGTQQYMAAKGIPLVGLLYLATVVVEVGGGLSVLLARQFLLKLGRGGGFRRYKTTFCPVLQLFAFLRFRRKNSRYFLDF